MVPWTAAISRPVVYINTVGVLYAPVEPTVVTVYRYVVVRGSGDPAGRALIEAEPEDGDTDVDPVDAVVRVQFVSVIRDKSIRGYEGCVICKISAD